MEDEDGNVVEEEEEEYFDSYEEQNVFEGDDSYGDDNE